jgi:MGT family glycosyltransferase
MSRHYLFVLWDGAGTVPAELSVARELIERGHRVSVLADPTIEPEATAIGAGFCSWGDAPHLVSRRPEDDLLRDFEARTPPQLIARLSERLICGPARVQAAETARAIAELRPDALVINFFLLGPQMAAEAAGLPVAVLMANIYPLPAPGMPPFGTGWQPGRGAVGRARDAALARFGARLWGRGLEPVNAARSSQGLAPLAGIWDQLERAERVLVLTSASFDFPARLPANVRYVGPRLEDPAWVEPWTPPAGAAPLVLVSLSSGYQDQLDLLRRIAATLADLPVRAVITTGYAIDPGDVPAPAGVRVVRSAPHSAVLREAAAVVTHGGHGTVIKTLAAGVPMLVLPMGRDQLDNAARVTARGAGLRLRPGASSNAIAAAVRRVLDEPAHREGARRMAEALRSDAERDGAAAARELEALPSALRHESAAGEHPPPAAGAAAHPLATLSDPSARSSAG